MGIDIFMFVERRSRTPEELVRGVWTCVRPPHSEVDWDWDLDRNYDLFAILAGIMGRDEITPIAPMRGCPPDATAEALGCGMPHSYLTLRELVEFDWSYSARRTGTLHSVFCAKMLLLASNASLADVSSPSANKIRLSGDMMRRYFRTTHFLSELRDHLHDRLEVLSTTEDERVEHCRGLFKQAGDLLRHYEFEHDPSLDVEFEGGTRYFADASWDETYASMAGTFYASILPKIREIGDLDDVRIVFLFT